MCRTRRLRCSRTTSCETLSLSTRRTLDNVHRRDDPSIPESGASDHFLVNYAHSLLAAREAEQRAARNSVALDMLFADKDFVDEPLSDWLRGFADPRLLANPRKRALIDLQNQTPRFIHCRESEVTPTFLTAEIPIIESG